MSTPPNPPNWPQGAPPQGYWPPPPQPGNPLGAIIGVIAIVGILVLAAVAYAVFQGPNGGEEAQKRGEVERRAADGDLQGMMEAGDYYKEGFMTDASDENKVIGRDYLKAREWYQKAAAKFGSPQAMDRIGYLYVHGGWGIKQDFAAARQWFEKGAAAGGPEAMDSLGDLYYNGYGVESDGQTARQWHDRANAARGKEQADYTIARLEKAANAGDVSAMNGIADIYMWGRGIPTDRAKARDWYEKAVATGGKGSVAAMTNLGDLYMSGDGIAPDYPRAHDLLEKAAATGNRDAMCKLAEFYSDYHKTGMQDLEKSRQWNDKCHEIANGAPTH
jgi:TPR repeat protein